MATILIVEDDISILNLYEILLHAHGYKTIRALNGEKAIKIFKSLTLKPDIILMDHRLPIKNGLEAAIEIKEIDNNAKIIFMSADNSIKDKSLSMGAISFIEKPFDFKKLILNIDDALKSGIKEIKT